MEHEAILNTHPAVAIVSGTGAKQQILDKDNNPVEINRDLVDAEIIRLQAEYDAQAYARSRATEYPTIVDQLDDIYHNGIDGWKATIKVTKDKYPKG